MNSKTASVFDQLKVNADGLVPVIVQDVHSKEVLMMAWMNREAFAETLSTGRMCYWSRSRSALWRKGESSGQVQVLHQLIVDCDDDTLLALVEQTGVACHTGRRSCFYKEWHGGAWQINQEVVTSPEALYGKEGK